MVPHMARSPRWFLPKVVYEVTARTIEGHFLLRPDDRSREVIMGVIGRALALSPDISVHAFVFLSNHFHILLSSKSGSCISSFLGYLKSNIARRIGQLRQRTGRLWEGRSSTIPITDNEALLGRLRYLLSNSVKEGLVERPEEWPGASSLPWFLEEDLVGHWIDRKLQRKALKLSGGCDPATYTLQYPISISPLPCWGDLSRSEIGLRTRRVLDSIAEEWRLKRLYQVMGIEAVLEIDPEKGPAQPLEERRPPLCHSSTTWMRTEYAVLHRSFVAAFREASNLMRTQTTREKAGFPFGSFPPAGGFVRPPADYIPPWNSIVNETWNRENSIRYAV